MALAALGLAAAAAANSQQQGQEQEQGSSGASLPQAGSPTPSPGGAGTSGAPIALSGLGHMCTLDCRCSTPHKHFLLCIIKDLLVCRALPVCALLQWL